MESMKACLKYKHQRVSLEGYTIEQQRISLQGYIEHQRISLEGQAGHSVLALLVALLLWHSQLQD